MCGSLAFLVSKANSTRTSSFAPYQSVKKAYYPSDNTSHTLLSRHGKTRSLDKITGLDLLSGPK